MLGTASICTLSTTKYNIVCLCLLVCVCLCVCLFVCLLVCLFVVVCPLVVVGGCSFVPILVLKLLEFEHLHVLYLCHEAADLIYVLAFSEQMRNASFISNGEAHNLPKEYGRQ